jgi:outer membrane protein assembly factor BamB
MSHLLRSQSFGALFAAALSIVSCSSLKSPFRSELPTGSARVLNLGAFQVTTLPGFELSNPTPGPWEWRGRFANGAPMQSFVEPQFVGSDEVLLSTLGGGVELRRLPTGAVVWSKPVTIGVASKPLILGSSVYVAGMDGVVRKFRLNNGQEDWTAKLSAESTGGLASAGGLVFVPTADDSLWALDEKTGQRVWNYRRPAPTGTVAWSLRGQALPAISPDGARLYIGFSDGVFLALETSSGNTVWERNFDRPGRFKDADLSPVLSADGGTIYLPLVDSDLLALRASNGATLWTLPDGGGATPLVDEASGVLFALTKTGQVQKVSLKDTSVVWSRAVESGGVLSKPAFVGKDFLAVSASHFGIVLIERESGKISWKEDYAFGPIASPVSDGRRLLVLSARNRLHLYRVEARQPGG